jgi:hypothetical protein
MTKKTISVLCSNLKDGTRAVVFESEADAIAFQETLNALGFDETELIDAEYVEAKGGEG